MQVVVTIMRDTGVVGDDKVPARDLSTAREVCFYKLDAPPSARVKFHTCGPKCERGRGRRPGEGGHSQVGTPPRVVECHSSACVQQAACWMQFRHP